MPRLILLVSGLAPLVACAPRRWVNPAITDPQQIAQDQYACMKENSFVSSEVTVNKSAARAGEQMKVDPRLFDACMAARGYVAERGRERPAGDPGWLERPAPSRGPVLEADLGFGAVWGVEHQAFADLSVLLEDPSQEPPVHSVAVLGSEAALLTRIGVMARPSPMLDVGGHVGVRPSRNLVQLDCDEDDGDLQLEDEDLCMNGDVQRHLAWVVSGGARLRPPSAPRLSLGAELGAQTLGATTALEEKLRVEGGAITEPVEVSFGVQEIPAAIVPFVRGSLGVDLVHPDPLGLSLGCAVEVALRGGELLRDAPEGWLSDATGQTAVGSCALTVRLDPRSKAAE